MTEIAHSDGEVSEQHPKFNVDGIQLMVVIPLSFRCPILSSDSPQASLEADNSTPNPRSADMNASFLDMGDAEEVAAQQLAQLRRSRPRRHIIGDKGLPDAKPLHHDEQSINWSDSPQSVSTTDRQPFDAESNTWPQRRKQAFKLERYADEETQTLDMDVEEGMMPRFRALAEFY